MKDTICIYHAKCADGFTSAWAVWKKYPDIEFLPATYGDNVPDVTNKDVIMVDFSYKRHILLDMAEQAKTILILDHHKSAQEDLVELPDNVTAIFDMEKSGARLAWEYFHPNTDVPMLVMHVEDRDLWKFNDSNTRAFQANLFSLEYTFENWEHVHHVCGDKLNYDTFVAGGEAIERKHFKDVKELISVASYESVLDDWPVPFLNAPYFYSSDAGDIMSERRAFAVCYYDTKDERVFSLRSNAEYGSDVSKLASKFGGGGHKNAAGFRWPLDKINEIIQE